MISFNFQPSFLLFFLFFTHLYYDFSIENTILGAVLIISLLVHELGHALAAKYFGASSKITLGLFGGMTSYEKENISEKQRCIVTLCGPLLESILILAPYCWIQTDLVENYYLNYTLYVMIKLNILWCLLNLIPIQPLDGGVISKYLLEKKFGSMGLDVSYLLGIVSAIVGGPYLLLQGYFFFGSILLFHGFRNIQTYRIKQANII